MITPRNTPIRWPEARIDHIAACKVVVRELLKEPKGKPFSKIALARRTGLDPKTVDTCVVELLGKNVDGVVSKTTPNGHDLVYIDPPACDTLMDTHQRAAREGEVELARGTRILWTKLCQPRYWG